MVVDDYTETHERDQKKAKTRSRRRGIQRARRRFRFFLPAQQAHVITQTKLNALSCIQF